MTMKTQTNMNMNMNSKMKTKMKINKIKITTHKVDTTAMATMDGVLVVNMAMVMVQVMEKGLKIQMAILKILMKSEKVEI